LTYIYTPPLCLQGVQKDEIVCQLYFTEINHVWWQTRCSLYFEIFI